MEGFGGEAHTTDNTSGGEVMLVSHVYVLYATFYTHVSDATKEDRV